MSLFDNSRRRRVNRLSKVSLDELSVVDRGANEKSCLLLKRHDGSAMAIDFQPICFQKSGQPVAPLPTETEQYPAGVDPEMNIAPDVAPARKAKKMRKAIKKALRRLALAKADRDFSDGQSGGGFYSESDRVGAQDARSDVQHVDDTATILREILRSPPVASESWTKYSVRVFGVAALSEFTTDEMEAAKAAYHVCLKHAGLKAWAAASLDNMAKAMSAETGKPFQSCFLKAAQTPAGQKLYAYMHDVLKADDRTTLGAMQMNGDSIDTARSALSSAHAPGNRGHLGDLVRNDVADAASMSPSDCNKFLLAEAQKIKAEHNVSSTAALSMTYQRYPALYKKSKTAQS